MTDEQMKFVHDLEHLAAYAGREADDDFRDLAADVQDEFVRLKRGAVREGLEKDGPLTAADVLTFGAELGQDFPEAQRGCEVFASVVIAEKAGAAPLN
jgi:hypothetical protein